MAMICVSGTRECDGCMACRPDPRVVFECTGCEADVYEGSECYEVAGEPYCEDCVNPMTAELEE